MLFLDLYICSNKDDKSLEEQVNNILAICGFYVWGWVEDEYKGRPQFIFCRWNTEMYSLQQPVFSRSNAITDASLNRRATPRFTVDE